MTNKGLFISFEGVEGSGKTTQLQRVYTFLLELGLDVIQTKEPGGTSVGQSLRHMILDVTQPLKHRYTEVFLFYADRLEHLETVVKPALLEGKIVLCDRYIDSTYAYQVGGRQIPFSMIETLNDMIDMVLPELTILLDLDPEQGIDRVKKRSAMDRFEQEALSFHHRVRETYLRLMPKYPARMVKIDVKDQTEDEVFEKIKPMVQSFLKKKGKI